MNPIPLERLEGAVICGLAVWTYAAMGASWWLFALLILAPDIGTLGYLRGPKLGALTYNFLHTYALPLALAILGYSLNEHYLMVVPVIWIAHIGADRALGYGLKVETNFKDTHLGRLGSSNDAI